MEAKDIRLEKAKQEDWQDLYRNLWSRPESARYMLWQVTENEDTAKIRMEKSVSFQRAHEAYTIYEKKSGQAIGFAGMTEVKPHVYEDTGIAIGPDYTGKGYGKDGPARPKHLQAGIFQPPALTRYFYRQPLCLCFLSILFIHAFSATAFCKSLI